ncbi:MAG: APC family permease [Novosphingobium sp.]
MMQPQPASDPHPHHVPKRVLSTWSAAAVVVGMVIGAGIFRTSPLVAQSLGSEGALLLAWALGGAFALIGALCYAELAAAFPATGGDYRFLREAFGADTAYLFAWSRFAVIFSASGALLAFVGIDYIAELVPMDTVTRAVVAGGMVVVLTALNLQGVQIGTRAQIGMVALDIIALLALGAAALWLVSQGIPAQQPGTGQLGTGAAPATDLNGFGQAMIFIMLAYGGFNDASTLSAEVRKPRDMTRALVGGMAMITALYMIANWAYLRGLGYAGLAASEAPAAALMKRAFGQTGETVIVLGVAVASFSVLNALIIVGGRTLYAAAEDEPALARLAEWDQSRGVPRAAILVQTAVELALIAWGSTTGRGFATMVDYLSPIYWLFLTMSGLAVIVLRQRQPEVERPYKVPLYPLLPLIFAASCAYVFASSVHYVGWSGCLISFGVLAFGLLVRAAFRLTVKG